MSRPPRLSSDEARALVAEAGGNVSAAARAYGVPRNTLRNWLDPEKHRDYERRRYQANPEPRRARNRATYHNLSGLAYARRLLQMRRVLALHRMAERNRRITEGGDLVG